MIYLLGALFFSKIILAGVFEPLPKTFSKLKRDPITLKKIELGKKLFFETRLSKDGTLSCNSCHNVMGNGAEYRKTSLGVGGQLGKRNSPTVWNSAFLSVQFWDGREPNLEGQAKGPITNPIEMAMDDHTFVLTRIQKIPGYVKEFKTIFGNTVPLTIDHVAGVIAAYEKTLITPNSAFDQFLKGNSNAINEKAKKGYQLVQDVGCIACHMGVVMAGPDLPEGTGFFQKFPVFTDNTYVEKYQLSQDLGRFEVTKKEEDKNKWRVPTWRNIAVTAPYMHNGQVPTLSEAVRVMAKTQLNRDLNEEQTQSIVSFLETLTGEFPNQTMPRLPESIGHTIIE